MSDKEIRYQRMEDKIDEVKSDIVEVKIEITEIKTDMKHHMDAVETHILGDDKIITALQPIISKLPHIVEMAEEYHLSKQIKSKVIRTAGYTGTIIGILVGVLKIVGLI